MKGGCEHRIPDNNTHILFENCKNHRMKTNMSRRHYMKLFFIAACCLAIGCAINTQAFAENAKETAKGPLFVQSDLNRQNGEDIGNGVWRVETKSDGDDGVATGTKAIPGGSSYTVSFEARGNDNLILMASGEGVKRIDPLKNWQPLSNDWKKFKAEIKFPASAQNIHFAFFYWNKPGKWFEIRNFKVVPR